MNETWNCQDPWYWLYQSAPFWTFKTLEIVLAPSVTLINILLVVILRKEPFKIPVSLKPHLYILAFGSICLGTYMFAKNTYVFGTHLQSKCPMLISRVHCLYQELILIVYLSLFSITNGAIAVERLVWLVFNLSLPQSQQSSTSIRLICRLFIPMFSLSLIAGLAYTFLSMSFWKNEQKRKFSYLLTCEILDAIPFPIPLCFTLTLLIIIVVALGVFAAANRFQVLGTEGAEGDLTGEMNVSFVTSIAIQGISLLAVSIHLLTDNMREIRTPTKRTMVTSILLQESLFYTLTLSAAFLHPLLLIWSVHPLRKTLEIGYPCLNLRPVETKDLPPAELPSLHSLPDDFSQSTDAPNANAANALTKL